MNYKIPKQNSEDSVVSAQLGAEFSSYMIQKTPSLGVYAELQQGGLLPVWEFRFPFRGSLGGFMKRKVQGRKDEDHDPSPFAPVEEIHPENETGKGNFAIHFLTCSDLGFCGIMI